MIGISLMIVGIVTAVISGGLTGRMVKRFGEKRTLYIGQFFGASGMFMAGLAKTGAWLLASIPIISLWNISMPAAQSMMTHRVSEREQGELQGALQSMRSITFIIGPVCSCESLGGLSIRNIRFTCRARLIISPALFFSRRCSWQRASDNRSRAEQLCRRFLTYSAGGQAVRGDRADYRFGRKGLRYAPRERSRHVKAITRYAAVAVAICSWIAVSNHCAFAAVATEIDKAQTECPFHSKPAKQKEQSSQLQCCKILRAVVFAKTKDWARDDAKFCDAIFRFGRARSLCIRRELLRRCYSIPAHPARVRSLN